MRILAEFLTIGAYIYGLICSRYVVDYKKQLITRIIDDGIWCLIHFLFGNTIALICVSTGLVFQVLIGLKTPPIIPAIVIFIQLIFNLIHVNGFFDYLPLLGSLIYCIILLRFREGKYIKIAIFTATCFYIPYYIHQGEIAPTCVGILTLLALIRNYFLNFI